MIMIGQFSQHVEDVDLFSGGLAERPLSGAVVGPTFGCLLGQQFEILKKGDRFWYENNIPPSALSKGELAGGGRERGTGLIKHTVRQFHGTITSMHIIKIQSEVFDRWFHDRCFCLFHI